MAIFLLVVVLLTPDITSVGQGFSHCIQADSNIGQHGSCLCKQYCCIYGNSGKTFNLKEKGRKLSIFCPSTQPKSCPGNVSSVLLVYLSSLTKTITCNYMLWF